MIVLIIQCFMLFFVSFIDCNHIFIFSSYFLKCLCLEIFLQCYYSPRRWFSSRNMSDVKRLMKSVHRWFYCFTMLVYTEIMCYTIITSVCIKTQIKYILQTCSQGREHHKYEQKQRHHFGFSIYKTTYKNRQTENATRK